MNFAVPIALAWAALAVPIVIFYILKIRLRRVPVSTTIFWEQIFDEKKPRSLWQQLRHLLSLLAQLLLLVLMVLALADPFFSWEMLQARRLVLIVDNSASMNAVDVSPSRLHEAKRLGRQQVDKLRLRDEMAIVVAGTQPRVVCGMTGHQRTLRTALAEIEPTDGPTESEGAVQLARRLLGDHPRSRVILLSDARFDGAEQMADAEDVDLHLVGQRTGNVAITRFQARRSLVDPVGYEMLVEVVNAADDPVECRLEIDLNESPVDVVPLKLAAGEVWTQTFEKTAEDGGRLSARLDRSDALLADNSALALLPQRHRQQVILVTKENLFLQRALEANPLVDLTVVGELPEDTQPDQIVVFHRDVPQTLPMGNLFVVDPSRATDLWEVGDPLSNPIVTGQDEDSELMRHVHLDNVLLPEARQLTPLASFHPLVESVTGDPLYSQFDRPQGKVLVLTVNLDKGDLTFRTAFPIMVTNALGWFAGRTGELQEALAAGETATIELPEATADSSVRYTLVRPSGETMELPQQITETTIGPLDECGIWSVRGGPVNELATPAGPNVANADDEQLENSLVIELACSLANADESDLRVPTGLLSQPAPAALAAGWLTRPIWFYLIALAWILVALEWFLYQRRWIS